MASLLLGGGVWVFITGESESQNKEKQIWSYEERRGLPEEGATRALMRLV